MENNHPLLTIAMISEHGDPLAPLGGQQSGGQNVYVYEVSKALSTLGVKVDVFTRWENRKADQRVRFAQRAKVIRLKAGPRQFISKDKFGPLMPEFVEHFLEYSRLNKIKYDLIHAHYYFSGWAGLQLKNILKIPLIEIFHSLGVLKKKALGERDTSPTERTQIERRVMHGADKIIAISPQEKISMISEYDANPEKITVIPAGVNLRRFKPLQQKWARENLNLSQEKKIVLFAGKMERRKGAITLVQAIAEIKKRWPKIYQQLQVIMFSGDPRRVRTKEKQEADARHDLKNAIVNYKVGDKIKLMQGVGQEKLHIYYGAADVVVMPSYYEPFGMVAIEAMATGTPVVASSVGGLQWTIEDGITGFHARPKDALGFARQIVKVLSDEELADRMGKNAVIHVQQNYSWPHVTRKIYKLYKQLLVNNARKKGRGNG